MLLDDSINKKLFKYMDQNMANWGHGKLSCCIGKIQLKSNTISFFDQIHWWKYGIEWLN